METKAWARGLRTKLVTKKILKSAHGMFKKCRDEALLSACRDRKRALERLRVTSDKNASKELTVVHGGEQSVGSMQSARVLLSVSGTFVEWDCLLQFARI